MNTFEKADILIEALPYMQKFAGSTIVVKYGGNAMKNAQLKQSVLRDIIFLKYSGIRPVVVHGGGPELTAMLNTLNKKSEFISGLRVTDAETAAIAEMVFSGKTNREIVQLLNSFDAKSRAIGLNGKDANLLVTSKKLAQIHQGGKTEEVDVGFVGDIKKINTNLLLTLLESDYIPVIAPIGIGEDGETYNINADYVAGEIAVALQAEKLALLTDVEGIYLDYQNKDSFVSTMTLAEAQEMIKAGKIAGGMIPKLEACITALVGGVEKTHILDGREPHSLLLEIFTEKGIGTEVVKYRRYADE
jgi:acetylglutamate kinase